MKQSDNKNQPEPTPLFPVSTVRFHTNTPWANMSGWDSASVSFIPGGNGAAAARIQLGVDGQPLENAADKSTAAIELKLLNFLRTFMDHNNQFIYRQVINVW
jgi:hypothetical protein